jgi:hypothetical protein
MRLRRFANRKEFFQEFQSLQGGIASTEDDAQRYLAQHIRQEVRPSEGASGGLCRPVVNE